MEHCIYALCDPRTNEVRYVGMAINPRRRYAQHLLYPAGRKGAWLQELDTVALLPSLQIIEANIPAHLVRGREDYWIRYYVDQGADLTNIVLPGIRGARSPQQARPHAHLVNDVGDAPAVMSMPEIETCLRLSSRTILNLIRQGDLDATKDDRGHWRITSSAVQDYIQRQRRKAELM